jgi:hypothetical protein
MVPTVHNRLVTNLSAIWREAAAVRDHSTRLRTARRRSDSSALGPRSPPSSATRLRRFSDCPASPEAGLLVFQRGDMDNGISSSAGSSEEDSMGPGEAPSSCLASCNGKRLCTAAMVKVGASSWALPAAVLLQPRPRARALACGHGAKARAQHTCGVSPAPHANRAPHASAVRQTPNPTGTGQVVEQEILKCKRLTTDSSSHADRSNSSAEGCGDASDPAVGGLVLSEVIGAGGYGAVWRGSWKKVTAAIKVWGRRGTWCFGRGRSWPICSRLAGTGPTKAASAQTKPCR